jgi:hypothetical protein
LGEESHNVGDSRTLLANGDVNTVERLLVVSLLIDFLLIDDGINGNGGLASLSVSNDEFTLASSNWNLLN